VHLSLYPPPIVRGVNVVVARREQSWHEKISYFFIFLSFLFPQKVCREMEETLVGEKINPGARGETNHRVHVSLSLRNEKNNLSHNRAKIDGDVATVGITDHAQAELGDIVYVELPEVGAEMEATKSFGVVESVKAASDVYSPVSGTVIEVNEALNDTPGTVNESPFEGGWLMKVKVSDVPGSLMDAAAYEKSIA